MKQFEKTGEVDTSEVAAKLKNLKQKREDEKSEGEGGSASTEQFWDVCEAIQNEFVEFEIRVAIVGKENRKFLRGALEI